VGMYKTILVPLDGSARAEKILPHVKLIASNNQARVVFLRVIEPIYRIPNMLRAHPDTWRDAVNLWYEQADAYLMTQQTDFEQAGVKAETRIEEGIVVETIIQVAEEEDADLIAMTSHGLTGLARVFYGKVASGVLNRVDRPLLMVRG